jgi:hypothetical protein
MKDSAPYPWKLRAEDLPPVPPTVHSSAKWPPLPWAQLAAGMALMLFGASWLVAQNLLLEPAYTVKWSPESLPALETSRRVTVVPSPVRYSLLSASVSPAEMESAFAEKPSISKPEAGFVPVNFTPDPLPNPAGATPLQKLSLSPPPPPALPEGPRYSLVGIAQGHDGVVATLKMDGETTETKDVREGETLANTYKVLRIAPEYVLLQNKKDGKTLRVD